MDHNLYHSVTSDREMYMRCVVETIVTSFLLLSRVWARPSDVVCDGGRGEGAKWFDGCRWCVCQRSGPMCSSAECSPLVSRVLPCQNVESRWWDGCYHCKCYRHGIECTASESCLLLMRTERFYTDFLSRGACVNPKDDRCVCGIDGVPSCSAEVIDRNAFPATTIGLNPVFPSSSSLVVPKVIYYQRPFRSYEQVNEKIRNPEYYSDSTLYKDYRRLKRSIQQSRLRHSLIKRQTINYRRHSPESAQENSNRKQSRMRRKTSSLATEYSSGSSITKIDDQLYRKVERRDCSHNFICRYDVSLEHVDARDDSSEDGPHDEEREVTEKRTMDGSSGFSESSEDGETWEGVDMNDQHEGWGGVGMNDQPQGRNKINSDSPSLLIASDNRCRWGVRWYGGSLRCYCDLDNSITCGDPSFVASRIDGFRLESASCEEGHVWEDEDSCRQCECQINGVVLCRRSPSCPLPFLIKPLSLEPDEDNSRDHKELTVDQKGPHSGGLTDEFTEQKEQKIDLDITGTNTDPTSDENISTENNDRDIYVNKDSTDKDYTDGTIDENTVSSFTDAGESEENLSTSSESNLETMDLTRGSDYLNLVVGPTDPSTGITDQYSNYVYTTEDDIEDKDSIHNNNFITIIDKTNTNDETDAGDVKKKDSKETTQVFVEECKPKSRWLDGCKRCECGHDGKKLCDDSRCLKPMSVTMEMTNASSDFGDKRHTRPVQRPPSDLYLPRDKPISLSPAFLSTKSCGRFNVGQKYWEDCNMCVCTSQGPKCTAKNCA